MLSKGQFVQDGRWILENTAQVDLLPTGNAMAKKAAETPWHWHFQPKYVAHGDD